MQTPSSQNGGSVSPLPISPALELERLFEKQRRNAPLIRRTTAAERAAKLRRLKAGLLARREEARAALAKDFFKPAQEVDLSELSPVTSEAAFAARHVKSWMASKQVATPLALLGNSSEVQYEPKGVALIISPWNYPINLTLGPLVGAIAAGNCAILKPSELTPHSAAFLRDFIASQFPEDEVAVVEGDASVSQRLLRLPFDHIFFTGSPQVGKLVMKAAAENLVPVTLELGGKSPAIVDDTADLALSAEKICFGKFSNGGQTCIAPDYVLVHERLHDRFVQELEKSIQRFYGKDEAARGGSPDLAHGVNDRHFQRLQGLVSTAVAGGAKVSVGGTTRPADRYIAPTVLTEVPLDSPIMTEEIFGPVLPVVRYRTLDEALAVVHGKDKPLALYIFSGDKAAQTRILQETTAGGTCVNETLIHYLNPSLPFGGVGVSGAGRAHGYAGFLTFSNERAVLRRRWANPTLRKFLPPYGGKLAKRLVDFLLRYL